MKKTALDSPERFSEAFPTEWGHWESARALSMIEMGSADGDQAQGLLVWWWAYGEAQKKKTQGESSELRSSADPLLCHCTIVYLGEFIRND